MQNETDKDGRNFAEDNIYNGNKKEPYTRAWFNIGIGLIFVIAGAIRFFSIQKWEINGGTIEMSDITQWVYKWGGKWGILGLILLPAIYFISRGLIRLKQLKAMEKL
jgi:hypothetical protein